MTKVSKKVVKCAKCGYESEQLVVYSVNFMIGSKDANEKLMSHKQICPKCNYAHFDISVLSDCEDKK